MKIANIPNLFRELRPGTSSHLIDSSAAGLVLASADTALLLDLANLAWDLRRVAIDARTAEPKPNMNKVSRHVERLWDLLEQAGLKIQDHVDQPFDSGQSLRVLAFQPTPGITREVVIETVRPTVYLKDDCLQTGQVVVGTPKSIFEEANHDTEHN